MIHCPLSVLQFKVGGYLLIEVKLPETSALSVGPTLTCQPALQGTKICPPAPTTGNKSASGLDQSFAPTAVHASAPLRPPGPALSLLSALAAGPRVWDPLLSFTGTQ